ncbi:MAG: hypothetical protein ACM3PP_11320, partial [Candidatus Saccharibacteria bacterium]
MKVLKPVVFLLLTVMALSIIPVDAWSAVPDGKSPNAEAGKEAVKARDYLLKQYKADVSDWGMIALSAQAEGTDDQQLIALKRNWLNKTAKQIQSKSGTPSITTDYARLTLAVTATGGDPHSCGGIDLVQKLINSQTASGKFADSVNGTGEELVNAHIWAIIALYSCGSEVPHPEMARRWLINHQHRDGGFGFRASSAVSDVDITAQALLTLYCLGDSATSPVVRRGLSYLKKHMTGTGGFTG